MRKQNEYLYYPKIGERYNKWEIISEDIMRIEKKVLWSVKCSCGEEKWIDASSIRTGRSKACMRCGKTKYGKIERYFNKIKYQASKRNIDFQLDTGFIISLLEKQNYMCAISGYELDHSTISLDRINSDLPYRPDNVQWVHKQINMMKGSLKQPHFIFLCKRIAEYN